MSAVVDKAIQAGKFSESRRAYYERAFAWDPEGTERVIEAMTAVPGLDKLAASVSGGSGREQVQRGRIESSAGLPLRPHPLGGYYVERP